MKVLALSVLLLVLIYAQLSLGNDQRRSPILIVPGLLSSQLEAKVSWDGFSCKTIGYESYWLNILQSPRCVAAVLSLYINFGSGRYSGYSDAYGVDVRVSGDFGETDSVEFLDKAKLIPMFHEFVEYFVKRGYERGKDIRAAPYDWRLPIEDHDGYFLNVKDLIEEMYEENGTKVTIIDDSTNGGKMTRYFLNNYVSQSWIDQYINAFISLAGTQSGADMVQSVLRILLGGFDSLSPAIPKFFSDYMKNISPAFMSFPDIWPYSFPHPFTNAVVHKPHPEYAKIHAWSIIRDPPNVPTYCFYSVDVDDQVNQKVSLKICPSKFPGETNSGMLSHKEVLSEIAKVVFLGN